MSPLDWDICFFSDNGQALTVLDQTFLPTEERYIELRSSQQVADAIARLDPERQREIAKMITSGELDKHDVLDEVKRKKSTSARIPKSTDEHLVTAKRALKRALTSDELPDRVLIAECRNLLDKLDPDKASVSD